MSFAVEVRPGGRSFKAQVGSAVLDAAIEAGVSLPHGCRNAVCRACQARLVEGRVAYPLGPPAALSAAEVEAGKVLLCQARAESDLVIEVDEPLTVAPRTLPCRLAGKSWLSHDVLELRLVLREGDELQGLAGQYVDVLLRDGRRRAFSVANVMAGARELELQVRVVPGGEFSTYAAHHLKERAFLRVRGPLGAFYLRKDHSRPVILVAGGTGFAPMKAIVEDALASGFSAPVHLYWGARARRDLYQHDLAVGWAAKHAQVHYTPVLSEPSADESWRGRVGFVHQAVLDDFGDLAPFSVYLSGPPVMVQSMRREGVCRGLDEDYLYADSFDYAYLTGHDRAG